MTTSTFVTLMIIFVLLIVVFSRIEGSPKLCVNLLFALAFGVVVGYGIQSKKSTCTHSEKDHITMISNMNQQPIQSSLLVMNVTAQPMIIHNFVGKAKCCFIEEGKDLQQPIINPDIVYPIGSYAYEDSG